jgi:hypothetical protein
MSVLLAIKRSLFGGDVVSPPQPHPEHHELPSEADKPEAPDLAALASAAPGLKLNLGCGFDLRPGWMNIDLHDFHKPDLVCDVTWLKPIEDNVAGYVVAQDVLEHIHRDRGLTALREWNRVTMLGGHLEIRVPDVLALADLMRRPDAQTPEQQAVYLQCLFGTQGYEGDFHLNGFTELSLRHALEQSGFELVSLQHQDEWLFVALARKVAHQPPEVLLRAEGDDAFLDQVYQAELGRAPDAEGRAFWLGRLQAQTPREVVLAAIRFAAKQAQA